MIKAKNFILIIFSVFLYFWISPQTALAIEYNQSKETPSPPVKQEVQQEHSMPEGYEGVYIEIDKTRNTLKVYLNNTVVKKFRVATGKNETLTPEGKFQIITKVVNPWYLPKKIAGGDKKNPLGTRWMGLNVPETGGYKYGIHGTSNPNSIGHHVSQGCIRMQNKDVEWLYRHIPLKTTVIIKSSEKKSDTKNKKVKEKKSSEPNNT